MTHKYLAVQTQQTVLELTLEKIHAASTSYLLPKGLIINSHPYTNQQIYMHIIFHLFTQIVLDDGH